MTIIYSDLHSVTSLRKIAEGEYELSELPVSSSEEILTHIQEALTIKQEEATPASSLELSKLTSSFAKISEDIVWHLKVLGDEYEGEKGESLVEEELIFLHHQLQQLQARLHDKVKQQTQRQIEKLGNGLKINLGAGDFKIDGWINVDMFSSDLPYNVLWGLPFKDNTAAYIYSAYLLEHTNYKQEALKLLKEVHRVLQQNGILRICVPNIQPFIAAYLNHDEAFFKYIEEKWGFSFGGTLLEKVLNYAGVGHKPGTVDDHKFAYDAETLESLLTEAGFYEVYPCAYMQSPHDAMKFDLNSLSAEHYNNHNLCLIYEAVK